MTQARCAPSKPCHRATPCASCGGEVACMRPLGHLGDCRGTCHTWTAAGFPEARPAWSDPKEKKR